MMMKCIFKRMSLRYLVTITQRTLKNISIPCRRRNKAPCRFGLLLGADVPEKLEGFHRSSLFLPNEKVHKIPHAQQRVMAGGASSQNVYMVINQNLSHTH